ncbi:MAG: tetratricopeptide repeat protein [Verrucomicrobia bacterium]|nr:tetratricopeptide repeat protein [Deltaproteobacteria bacterium]
MIAIRPISGLFLLLAALLQLSAPLQLNAASNGSPLPAPRSSDSFEIKLEQARKSYELFPLNEGLKHNLAEGYAAYGHTLFKQKQYEQADENLVKAIELYPDEPVYALLRGICTYNMKKYDVARYELERVLALQPESAEALIYLGLVLYESDNRQEAVQLWEQALKLAPGRADLVQLLEKARKETAVEAKMDRGNSSRFNLTYDPGVPAAFALAVLDVLESASNQVGAELGHFPEARVPVAIYKRDDYKTVTAAPDWSGGVYDGTIRLPFGAISEITAPLRAILFHEYAHVVVFDLTRGNCPVWLNEGIAEMFGRRQFSHPQAEQVHAAPRGTAVDFRKLEGSFSGLSTNDATTAYQQSHSMVNYLSSTYGWHRVKELLVNLGKGMSMDAAVELALQDYSISYSGLINEWRENVQRGRLTEN